jgi:hypothetical protein
MTDSSGPAETPETMPDWEKRFRAPRVSLPDWAEDAPDRSLFVSNATGTYELYAWDRATGAQRQVTDRPNGTTDGVLTPDGAWIWWFDDTDGDEFGVWRRQPFHGGPDEEAVPGLEPSYPAGLALGRDGRTAVVGRSADEEGTSIHLAREGEDPVEIYRHPESAGVGDLSHDGSLIAIEHTEHGDAMHSALRVLRPDGATVAELDDTKGGTVELGLEVLGFAPVEGDTRLLVGHQRRGRWEPMVWDVATGEETDLALELPGDVSAEWYPDGSALLIAHSFEARSELFRLDLASRALEEITTPPGTVSGVERTTGGPTAASSTCGPPPPSRPWCVPPPAAWCWTRPARRRPPRCRWRTSGSRAPAAASTRWCRSRPGRAARCPPSSTSTAAPPGTTATPSPPARPPGSTTATRWSG